MPKIKKEEDDEENYNNNQLIWEVTWLEAKLNPPLSLKKRLTEKVSKRQSTILVVVPKTRKQNPKQTNLRLAASAAASTMVKVVCFLKIKTKEWGTGPCVCHTLKE